MRNIGLVEFTGFKPITNTTYDYIVLELVQTRLMIILF